MIHYYRNIDVLIVQDYTHSRSNPLEQMWISFEKKYKLNPMKQSMFGNYNKLIETLCE